MRPPWRRSPSVSSRRMTHSPSEFRVALDLSRDRWRKAAMGLGRTAQTTLLASIHPQLRRMTAMRTDGWPSGTQPTCRGCGRSPSDSAPATESSTSVAGRAGTPPHSVHAPSLLTLRPRCCRSPVRPLRSPPPSMARSSDCLSARRRSRRPLRPRSTSTCPTNHCRSRWPTCIAASPPVARPHAHV